MKTTAVESVKRLLSLTYTITDPTSLEIITTAVKSLIEDAEKTVPRIGGIHQSGSIKEEGSYEKIQE